MIRMMTRYHEKHPGHHARRISCWEILGPGAVEVLHVPRMERSA